MTELKPCPFCSKTPKLIVENIKLDWGYTYIEVLVRCPECKTNKSGTANSKYKIGKDMSIKELFDTVNQAAEVATVRWNKRAET